MKKDKNPCENCEYEQEVYCTSPIGRCVREAKREKIHNTINCIISVIALILSIIVLIIRFS